MKKLFLLILFCLSNFIGQAQEVSCDDLIKFIENNGKLEKQVMSLVLDSSWLQKVTLYKYDNKYYVVAKIKKDEYSYFTKSYVFCNIPYSNWTRFYSLYNYSSSDTYGERFHKYIIDYICDCY